MNLLEMKNISKKFPGAIANDHVNLTVNKGEIHALLGENGAGKTTLMNILYGLYQPDKGEIHFKSHKVSIKSPLDAMTLGIGMIHQHFMLISAFSVLQNIILGFKSEDLLLDIKKERRKIVELSRQYSLKVDPDSRIWQLSLGEKQRVEILKALYRKADLLILDEPTAVLTPLETKELFKTLRSMKNEGHTIIFISHKLDEVFEICDKITVLRDAKVIDTVEKTAINKKKLARMMVGRDIIFQYSRKDRTQDEVILSINNLTALNDKDLPAIRSISFNLKKGEILGVAGVSGNGQRELAEAISGLRKVEGGCIHLKDEDVTNLERSEILKKGIGFIPEDRTTMGLILDFSIAENAILGEHTNRPFSHSYLLQNKKIISFSKELVSNYNIKTPTVTHPTKLLSGGNLQKMLLARELSRNPEVLIAAQPTRGLDVGATEYIHQILLEQRNSGTAILLISEDLDEILSLSDRIMVMYEGKIMGLVKNRKIEREKLGLMMTGAEQLEVKI